MRPCQGFTVFFTGLPASGKSTTAKALTSLLTEMTGRPVTLLDGDVVRQHLSRELGYSREDRDTNISRIAFVAGEVVRHGGMAVCAAIAPYARARAQARALITPHGRFVLVYVATPREVCETRDPKGLYRQARAGTLPNFTGVTDPYEIPTDAEIQIDASAVSPEAAARHVIDYLVEVRCILPAEAGHGACEAGGALPNRTS